MLLHHLILIPLLIDLPCFVRSSHSIYDSSTELCDKNAYCVALNNTRCLDITLSYKYSKLNGLLQDFNFDNEQQIHDYLDRWTGLKSVPRCWASIQPLLCTAFLPRCDEQKISLLSLQICRNVKINCKVLDQFISSNNIRTIPSFLNCNDTNLYQPKCKNEYTDIKFNSSAARCQYPLVSTDDSNIYLKNIEGCALDCDDPLYHKTDKTAFQNFLINTGCISLIVVLISTISYLPKWSNLSLTSKICFYIQICFAIHYSGWLMQAFINKRLIVCRSDQTLKYSEPNGSGLSCLTNFILIYYSAFSILSWYVIMAITTLNKKFKPNLYKNSLLYLHLCAWSSSFLFTIMAIAFSQIEGNYVYGICFISFSNRLTRLVFVMIPLTVGCLIYIYGMLYRAIPVRSLLQSSKLSENLIKRKEYKKIYLKLVVSSFLMSLVFVFSYIVFFNKDNDLSEWLESLNNEILCRLNLNSAFDLKNVCNHSSCDRNLKKSLTLDYWILLFVFGSGMCSSLWNFDFITILVWILEFKRKIDNTVRPDRIDERNMFFEKLLHDNQDPVKMNLDTLTTNPISNNRDLNQNKTTDSNHQLTNSKKLFEQKQLEKKRAKLEMKNQKVEHLPASDSDMIEMATNQYNHHPLNGVFNNNHNLNAFLSGNHNLPNGLPNGLTNNALNNNHLSNNLLTNGIPSSQPNQPNKPQVDNNVLKLNELKRRENESLNVFKTHGMSDQNRVNHIVNPFHEQRRPDSNLELNQPPNAIRPINENVQNNLMITNQVPNDNQNPFIIQNANLLQENMSHTFNHPFMPMLNPGMLNPFMPPMFYPFAPPQQRQTFLNFMQSEYNANGAANFASARNIADVEAKKREISETIHITQTVESASEANESFQPINESDISSICSFDQRLDVRMDTEQIPSDFKEVYDKLKPLNDDSSDEAKKNGK